MEFPIFLVTPTHRGGGCQFHSRPKLSSSSEEEQSDSELSAKECWSFLNDLDASRCLTN